MWVGGHLQLCLASLISDRERYEAELASVSDVILVKTHSLMFLCVCGRYPWTTLVHMGMQTMSASALLHKCTL